VLVETLSARQPEGRLAGHARTKGVHQRRHPNSWLPGHEDHLPLAALRPRRPAIEMPQCGLPADQYGSRGAWRGGQVWGGSPAVHRDRAQPGVAVPGPQ
jgi:hypothetical protein